jgi:hypothetical protein
MHMIEVIAGSVCLLLTLFSWYAVRMCRTISVQFELPGAGGWPLPTLFASQSGMSAVRMSSEGSPPSTAEVLLMSILLFIFVSTSFLTLMRTRRVLSLRTHRDLLVKINSLKAAALLSGDQQEKLLEEIQRLREPCQKPPPSDP